MRPYLVLMGFITLLLCGVAPSGIADPLEREQRISMNGLPLSLVPPADWLQDNWGPDRLAFSGPDLGGYSPNFTLAATPYRGYPSVAQIIDEIRTGLEEGVEVREYGSREVGRHAAGVLRIALELEGTRMVNEQLFVVGDGVLYAFSFMAPAEVYPALEPVFESVIGSIQVE